MGLLRFLLAISVILSHAGPLLGLELISGRMAVEIFFIISGFYMALILKQKYAAGIGGYRLFLTNRILRIYPLYFILLILTILSSIGAYFYAHNWWSLAPFVETAGTMNGMSLAFIIAVNLLIFGQDLLLFMNYSQATGSLTFAGSGRFEGPIETYSLLQVPQSWTLALEMMFYLIAPFLVRLKTWILGVIVILSLGLRITLYEQGMRGDPWTYRFFPNEIALFLAGILIFRLYDHLKETGALRPSTGKGALIVILFIVIGYQYIPTELLKQWALYVAIAISLPYIFELTRKNTIDRRIGELSYPIYISHLFLLPLVNKIAMPLLHIDRQYLSLCLAIATIIFSYILLITIVDPIDRFRARRAAKHA